MKILLASHAFAPAVGGIEAVGGMLAEQFQRLGHEVVVATPTPGPATDQMPYRIVRRPGPAEWLRLARWCDVFFQNNISLQSVWPLALVRRPLVIVHHTWIARVNGRRGVRDHLKLRLLRCARNIAVSRALAAHLGAPARVIGNPYRDDIFVTDPSVPRVDDLVFVGRLVSDKGVAVLLEALHRLRSRGVRRRLTIVGDGPERAALERQAAGLEVRFAGVVCDRALAALLNRHRVLVVPSLINEPFGIVALEGIACGCAVIASRGGGLPEAVGPCGVVFPNGDANALAHLLAGELPLEEFRRAAPAHLAPRRAEAVARAYLEVFAEALA